MDNKRVDITDPVTGMWSVSSERRDGANIWCRSLGFIPDHDLRALHHWAIDCRASGLLSYGWGEDFVIDDFSGAPLSRI